MAELSLRNIIAVRPAGDHRLFLRFADGAAGEVDLSQFLHFNGVFAPLRDPAYFATVHLDQELAIIVWPNGADLCPDVLRHLVTGESLPGQAIAGGHES
jgi:hypothetical protein